MNEVPTDATYRRAARRRRRRVVLLALVGVAVVVVGGYGLHVWRSWSRHVSTDDAFVEAHVSPVSARVRGTVVEVLVRDNQHVAAGAPLVRLDPRDLEVKVHQARAAVATAVSRLRTASAGVPSWRTEHVPSPLAAAGLASGGALLHSWIAFSIDQEVDAWCSGCSGRFPTPR